MFNVEPSTVDVISTFIFMRKKSSFKSLLKQRLTHVIIHENIMNDILLYNNDIVFFLTFFFLKKTKKLIFLEKLFENDLSSFSKIFNGTIFSVWENKNYSAMFLYEFWRIWRYRHKSRVKEDISISLLDYSRKVYMRKLYIYYFSKLIDIKHKILITSFSSINIRYFLVAFKAGIKNVVITKNKSLLVSPKYSSSSLHKYIDVTNAKYEYQFLRKNKVYNKGRYSRTRQNYRTGVYMCIYLSLTTIFGLYFIFYRFSFSFTHVWWLFVYLIFSFFAPKIIQNRLYEPSTLIKKSVSFITWIISIIKSIK